MAPCEIQLIRVKTNVALYGTSVLRATCTTALFAEDLQVAALFWWHMQGKTTTSSGEAMSHTNPLPPRDGCEEERCG